MSEQIQDRVPEEVDDPTPPDLVYNQGDLEVDSVLAAIAERQKEISESRQTYIAIPGYEDIGLTVQYHLLTGKELDQIGQNVRQTTKDRVQRGINMALDTIVNACDGFYIAREVDNVTEYVPIKSKTTGEPLKYDAELAATLAKLLPGHGWESCDSARLVALQLFGRNDSAVSEHSFRLNRWFQNTMRDAEADLLGEL